MILFVYTRQNDASFGSIYPVLVEGLKFTGLRIVVG